MRRVFLILTLLAAVLLLPGSCAAPKARRAGTGVEHRPAGGDHQAVLEHYRNACSSHPDDVALRDGYRAALEEVKKAADAAYEKGDYTSSGRTYFLLLKQYPAADSLTGGLSYTKKQIDERLDGCRDLSSQEALRRYRMGNLRQAIAVWKSILTFDPDNDGVRKSVKTATTQLQNLEQGY